MPSIKSVTRLSQVVLGFRPGVLFLDLDNTLFRAPSQARTPALCDPYAPGWLALARGAGWHVAGCTSRSPSLAAFTQVQLSNVRVALNPVLYTDGNAKGPTVVQNLLRRESYTGPVVVVDDQREQLESIHDCVSALLPHIQLRLYLFHG
jgi:predicted mannosyl-3-phosphoglycerate phosphatase (HAD superfamily)